MNKITEAASKITEAASKIMHLGSSEEPIEQPKPEEPPAEEPKPEETPQDQPVPKEPTIEQPPAEPSPPEAPKQQEPHPEQPIESQTQKPQPPEGQPLPHSQRVDAAYKLVYGEAAEVPTRHESIVTPEAAEWQIRYYMGGLFAVPNDHPLTQKFSSVDELLTWFDQTYPVQKEKPQE